MEGTWKPGTRLQVVVYHPGDCGFGGVTDDLLLDDTIFEKQQSRDTSNVVFPGYQGILIHIQSHNLGFALVLFRDSFYDRLNHPARRTPCCPEVNEDRHVGIQHLVLKVLIPDLCDFSAHLLNLLTLLKASFYIDKIESHYGSAPVACQVQ
jgi:hypothetical protein